MITRIVLCLTLIIVAGMPLRGSAEEDCTVFVVLAAEDVQTQLMAMVLTTHMATEGKVEQILLCGPAAEIALKGGEEVLLKPINKSPRMLLTDLIENGVTVQVCPLFLPNRGMTTADLLPGVTEANPARIARRLLEHGVKLFTF